MPLPRILAALVVIASLDALGAAPSAGAPSSPAPFDSAQARVAIQTYARLLEQNFVYPEQGATYAAMLRRNLEHGAYASFATDRAFAARVTADLQAVHAEGHLRLVPPSDSLAPPATVPGAGNGVGRAGWLAPGVAYLELLGFQGDRARYDSLLSELRAALDTLAAARTLVIDARPYVGGALEETDVLASYLFEKPTTLLAFDVREDIEKRNGPFFRESEIMARAEAPAGIVRRRQIAQPRRQATNLRRARVFVLTAKTTASGGEGFTLSLQRTKRATVIGAGTAGAGHFGRTMPLGGGYRAMIPIGRPFDPDTHKGWELVGLDPDVKVPADAALDEALKRAGVDVASGRRALAAMKARRS